MSRICYRFFGGFINAQEKWLNKIASEGFRLVRTTKMMYEFEECDPEKYQYKVEFIGHKSQRSAKDYVKFLEDCGYRVFFKNINLSYSVGKVKLRPWANKGARIATNSTTLNRELLIVEKENDGKAFELHTTFEDMIELYAAYRRPYIFQFLFLVILTAVTRSWICGIFAFLTLIPLIIYQIRISKLKKQAQSQEW